MTTPGFTGPSSLYETRVHYRSREYYVPDAVGFVVPEQLRRLGGTAVRRAPGNLLTSVGARYRCEGLSCTCEGDDDCNDMYSSGVCGDVTFCGDAGCWCLAV